MANLFDSNNAASTEPAEFTAGDFVQWKRADIAQDYPPSAYTLTYIARLRGGLSSEFHFVATNSSGVFLISATSATTAPIVSGEYYWQAEIKRNSDNAKLILEKGTWTVKPNLDQTGADPRSHAEIMLDKINALLEGRADKDVSSYSIQGRSIAKMGVAELTSWRDYYRKEVTKERQQAALANGKPTGTTVKVRFL